VVSPKKMNVDCKMNDMDRPRLRASTVLMLSLISSSSEKGWLGITKLQKLSFLLEYFLFVKGKRAFGYKFFMYDHGPISKGVYDDYESLLDSEIIIEDEDGVKVTDEGKALIRQFQALIPEDISAPMFQVVENYAAMKTHEIVNMVHGMEIEVPDGLVMRVDDIDRSFAIIPESPETAFKIDTNYLETFAVLSNKSLAKAIRDARRNGAKSKPYEPLFSS
jgi:uncharacterized phage-associated protein